MGTHKNELRDLFFVQSGKTTELCVIFRGETQTIMITVTPELMVLGSVIEYLISESLYLSQREEG